MTQIDLPEPVDEEAFRNGLTTYLQAADANGVTVERGWACRTTSGTGWEAEIVPIAPEESPSSPTSE